MFFSVINISSIMTMMYYIEFEFSFHGLHEVHGILYQDHPLSLFWLFATFLEIVSMVGIGTVNLIMM